MMILLEMLSSILLIAVCLVQGQAMQGQTLVRGPASRAWALATGARARAMQARARVMTALVHIRLSFRRHFHRH